MSAAILALLVVSSNEQWIMAASQACSFTRDTAADPGLRAIAVPGLVGVPLNYAILNRLLAIVMTVRAGGPFVAANARRLQAIGWALLAIQVLSLVIGTIAKAVSSPAHPLHLNAGFSIGGWLAVILTFLASVVQRARRVRDARPHRP